MWYKIYTVIFSYSMFMHFDFFHEMHSLGDCYMSSFSQTNIIRYYYIIIIIVFLCISVMFCFLGGDSFMKFIVWVVLCLLCVNSSTRYPHSLIFRITMWPTVSCLLQLLCTAMCVSVCVWLERRCQIYRNDRRKHTIFELDLASGSLYPCLYTG